MKKIFGLLTFIIAMFIGIRNVNAETEFTYNCLHNVCDLGYALHGGTIESNKFVVTAFTYNTDLTSIEYENGFHEVSRTVENNVTGTVTINNVTKSVVGKRVTIVLASDTTRFASDFSLGVFEFVEDDTAEECAITFYGNSPELNKCANPTTGIYYDKDGKKVTKEQYQKSCFACENVNGVYHGINGEELGSYQEWYNACGPKKYCEFDGTFYYGKDGSIVDKTEYIKECAKHTCEIIDGTHYDKDGKEVTEDEYLKSCFKCRKENGKYYDENGKETTKENWDVMCDVHKCKVVGNKYFDDKGKIVPKDVYDKACTNPKTGDVDGKMAAYTICGILAIASILFVSVKYKKLRRI